MHIPAQPDAAAAGRVGAQCPRRTGGQPRRCRQRSRCLIVPAVFFERHRGDPDLTAAHGAHAASHHRGRGPGGGLARHRARRDDPTARRVGIDQRAAGLGVALLILARARGSDDRQVDVRGDPRPGAAGRRRDVGPARDRSWCPSPSPTRSTTSSTRWPTSSAGHLGAHRRRVRAIRNRPPPNRFQPHGDRTAGARPAARSVRPARRRRRRPPRLVEPTSRCTGDVREVAILFIDLAGSTQLAANRADRTRSPTCSTTFFQHRRRRSRQAHTDSSTSSRVTLRWRSSARRCASTTAASAALATARDAGRLRCARLVAVDFGIGVSAGPRVRRQHRRRKPLSSTPLSATPVNEAAPLADRAQGRPQPRAVFRGRAQRSRWGSAKPLGHAAAPRCCGAAAW